jgi:8-amino-7-oxononanoate synthase
MADLEWLSAALGEMEAAGLRRRRRCVTPLPEGWCLVDGRRVRNYAGNDYLGLAHSPELQAAARAALENCGVGATASPLVSGRTPAHAQLEATLAAFEGAADAILYPTGMAANTGTLAALIDANDTIYCDRLNHASLVDGCRLAGGKLRVYRHDRLEKLEADLGRAPSPGRRWIVTDAVFSMDGTLAPLPELCDLAERYDAAVLVDEAHGTGVFGPQGRGVCALQQVESRVAVRIGTLSKALGTLGGFVTGSVDLIDYLWNSARTQMYSTALPPALCAAATAAVDHLQRHPELPQALLDRATAFRAELQSVGLTAREGSVGPIVPLVVGPPERAVGLQEQLLERGFLVGAIRPPTVPRDTARLRITLTLNPPVAADRELVQALADIGAGG